MKKSLRNKKNIFGLGLLVFASLLGMGCEANFLVYHRSRIQKPVHVYLNWQLVCVVKPKRRCERNMKTGRYMFFAEVEGTQHQWSSRKNPTPFVVDTRTVIQLYDPEYNPKKGKKKDPLPTKDKVLYPKEDPKKQSKQKE